LLKNHRKDYISFKDSKFNWKRKLFYIYEILSKSLTISKLIGSKI